MCLSSIYKKGDDENIFLLKNVARVICNEGELVVYDLMENTILIKE